MNFLFLLACVAALICAPAAFFLFLSREKLQSELARTREKLIALESRKEAGDQRLSEQQQAVAAMQEQLRLEFKNSASTLFEEISQKFSTRSEKQIGDLLHPLRERIGEFQKKIDDSFGSQAKEQFSLRKEIERIAGASDSLTKALKGDVKAQGNWGEVMLERILESSGLRKGHDYIVQGSDLGLRGAEGNLLRPDVIVHLPDGKHVVVDSKMSLVAYERYCGETDESLRQIYLKDFLKSVRNHVGGLAQKSYQDIEQLSTPDFVFLFMPIEGAYSMAVQEDGELHAYAWEKKIVIVPPAHLFAMLKTIASLWRIETHNQHAQEIAKTGGALYDKFVSFAKDVIDVGTHLDKAKDSYDDMRKKLTDGNGNLVSRAEKLRKMGAKVTKSMPAALVNSEEEADGEQTVIESFPQKVSA